MKVKTRRYYFYYLLKTAVIFLRLIPLKIGVIIAGFLGRISFPLLGRYGRIATSNLGRAFGGDRRSSRGLAKKVFENLGKNGAEWIKLTSMNRKDLGRLVTEVSGTENLDRALAEGNGVILLASHFGNWELLSIFLYSIGYTGTIIVRRIYFHKYDKFIVKLRNRFGADVLYRDASPKKLLKMLKNGEMLGILADQDVEGVDGVFVDFFGAPAYTPAAPVRLGLTTGANMVPAFLVRKPDNTHKLVLEKAIKLSPGNDREEDVRRYTQAWTSVLEKYVREHPEQWVWVHRRWKTQEEDKRQW